MRVLLFVCVIVLVGSGCATIFRGDSSFVEFVGGNPQGATRVELQGSEHAMPGGTAKIKVRHSREDIPLTVKCVKGERKGFLHTKFDMLLGGIGNLVFGGVVGWIVDGTGNKAYIPESPIDVQEICNEP